MLSNQGEGNLAPCPYGTTLRVKSLPVPPVYLTLKLLPLLVKVEPSDRLLNLPKIGLAEVLLITVKTVPVANVPVPLSTKVNGTLLLMVTPRAETSDALALVRFNTHL